MLAFVAEVNSIQEEIASSVYDWNCLVASREMICELVNRLGPVSLREIALRFNRTSCQQVLADYWHRADTRSPRTFFARALLQAVVVSGRQQIVSGQLGVRPARESRIRCPFCGDLPQAGSLQPQGDGKAQFLFCSLCLQEWSLPRGCCAACGDEFETNLSYYSSPDFQQFQLQTCESCHSYLLIVDRSKEPSAIPDIDELIALPLSLWAQEQGHLRIQPSLVGI
jgi:formate dehydrogenase accessory protein FdhE